MTTRMCTSRSTVLFAAPALLAVDEIARGDEEHADDDGVRGDSKAAGEGGERQQQQPRQRVDRLRCLLHHLDGDDDLAMDY